MSAPVVRSDYDQLTAVAARFDEQADLTRQALQQLRQQQEKLQGGDWLGTGAQAFYAEMNGQVVPSLNRLAQALVTANQITRQISQLMKAAEDEAARLLRANGSRGEAGAAQGLGAVAAAAGAIGAALADAPAGNGNLAGPGTGGIDIPANAKAFTPKPPPHAGVPNLGGASNPIPDPRGVHPYDRLPKRDGGYAVGIGGSQAVAAWARNFKQIGPLIEAQRQQLAQMKTQFNALVKKQSAAVRAAMKKDIPKGLEKLNDLTDNKAFERITEYKRLRDELPKADRLAAAAQLDLAERQHLLQAVRAEREKFEAGEQKAIWEARREEIRKAVDERTKVVGTLADWGGKIATINSPDDVAGLALEMGGDLIKGIVGQMTEAEMNALIKADFKIEALDEIMTRAADRRLTELNTAAELAVQSAALKLDAAQIDVRNLETAQTRTLDDLANLEKQHGTGRMFQELQEYNREVGQAGRQLRDATQDYMTTLEKNPAVADAGQLSQRVDDDIRHVSIYERDDPQWLEQAQGTGAYLNQMEQWRQGELATHRPLAESLELGKHVEVVDEVMDLSADMLGATPVDARPARK